MAGSPLKLLRVSGPLRIGTDGRWSRSALRSYVNSRDAAKFERCTELYFARGATLLELGCGGPGLVDDISALGYRITLSVQGLGSWIPIE